MSLFREIRVATDAMREDENGDLLVDLSFASETPYERWWGTEVLQCRPENVRLGRLNDGAPILFNHNWYELRGVHVPGSVRCDADFVLRGQARITSATQAGAETIKLVKGGVLTKTSVGYQIYSVIEQITNVNGEKVERTLDGDVFMKTLQRSDDEAKGDKSSFYRSLDERYGALERAEDTESIFLVVDWEPIENSLVTVPADPTVGVGRAAEAPATQQTKEVKPVITQPEIKTMPDDIQVLEHEKRGAEKALDPVKQILAIGQQYKALDMAHEAIQRGDSVETFQKNLIEKLSNKPVDSAEIGMSKKEAQHFSFVRAINALANPGDRRAQQEAAFEREASDAFAAKYGRAANGFFVPLEVQKRDLTVGTATAGGNTVATNLLAASFIELLRNKMTVIQAGAQVLGGLTGSVAIPRQTGGATAYWVAESGAPTESQQAFDQVTMAPKTVGAFTDISRKLLLQSSIDIEGFVRNDLATVLALEKDRAAINGSGSGSEPRGILNTSGIGDVAGGTNGLAPTWPHILELETDVSVANAAVGALGYLTNAKVRGKLKGTFTNSTYGEVPIFGLDGMVNGYNSFVTNQVPSNLTKGTSTGVCSAIIFGNFADLIIGEWGALDLMVDPYTGSTSGTVRVVALQDTDIAVRHPESFSAMKDALTA